VSCTNSSFCVAVDNIGVAFTYRGAATGWSQQTVDPSGKSLNSVSCASSTYCVAVGANGNVFFYNGSAWGEPDAADMGHDMVSVSCPSKSFCMAVDRTVRRPNADGPGDSALGLAAPRCPAQLPDPASGGPVRRPRATPTACGPTCPPRLQDPGSPA
jgi:uncharacterized Fe-S cluster protein YjdI